tara:strand:+ start:388 stop:639 length:252 start_codon:yes stop_codon:yes gene_type:complete
MSDNLLYDEYEQEELFMELAGGYVSECEEFEELVDKMAPYDYLVKDSVVPAHQRPMTAEEYKREALYNLYSEYWADYWGGYHG